MTSESRPGKRAAALPTFVALALVVAYPFLGILLAHTILSSLWSLGPVLYKVGNETMVWSCALVALAVVLFWGGRSAASIGLGRIGWRTIAFGIAGAVATLLFSGVTANLAAALFGQPAQAEATAAAMTQGSVIYAVLLALRAGVVEELLYRGIAIELLSELTGSRWAAALISLVLFVAAHGLVFEALQLIPIAAAALVMTLFYLWRRDLWANALAHVLVDAFGLILLALRA